MGDHGIVARADIGTEVAVGAVSGGAVEAPNWNLVEIAGPGPVYAAATDVPVVAPSPDRGSTTPGGTSGEVAFTPVENYSYAGDTPQAGGAEPQSFKGTWAEMAPEVQIGIDKMIEAGTLSKPVKDVQVVYQNHNADTKPEDLVKPDFIVKQDGTIVAGNNTERKPEDALVIEVERKAGERGEPTAEQQKALDGLVTLVADKYMTKDAMGALQGTIKDDQGLVSDQTKTQIAPNVMPQGPSSLPDPVRQQTEAVNRWNGSGGGRSRGGGDGGTFTPQQANDYIPQREVPRQAGETDKLVAIKDVIAGFASKDSKDPYHHQQKRPDGQIGVGRYGLNGESVSAFYNWLGGLSDEQIEELIKKGILPKDAKKLRDKVATKGADGKVKLTDEAQKFVDDLKGGKEVTNEVIDNLLGKEHQETAASLLIQQLGEATTEEGGEADVGKIALGMYLGKVPTEDDYKNPDYQKFMEAADKSYDLALQKVLQGDKQGPIDLSDAQAKVAARASANVGQSLWTEQASLTQNGVLGCAVSVSKNLRQAGVVDGNFMQAAVVGLDNALQAKGWQKVDISQAQPGDVIIGYRTSNPAASTGGGAHTGIVGEGGRFYSNNSNTGKWDEDSKQAWLPRSRGGGDYVNSYVLRAPNA